MNEEGQKGAGLARVWAAWRRRRWLAIAVLLVPLAATVSLVRFLPYVYKSTVLILVDRQQVPEEFVRPTVTSALETRLHTISEEILSRGRLEGLIARFGLYPRLRSGASSEELVERMRRDIKLDIRSHEARDRRATVAFTISYRGNDAHQVATVANTLASFYIEENLKVRERQAAGTAEFLRVQLDEVKGRLDVQERRVSEFKKRFAGELPQELEVNLATLERMNAQLRLNNDSHARALERRQALTRQLTDLGMLSGAPGTPGGSAMAALDPTAVKLARLKQELAELRTRFSDKYPDVVRLRAEMENLERELAEGKTNPTRDVAAGAPVDPQLLRMRQVVDEVEAEIKILKAEEERLRSTIGQYQRRVQETPLREQQYKELARDYDSTRELYASLLKRYSEAQIAESMEHRQKGEQFRILDPAIPAGTPSAPNRGVLLLLGLGFSLGLAVLAIVVAEQLDSSFHGVEDLRAFTSVPILVSIPRIVAEGDARRQRRRLRLAAACLLLVLVGVTGASYVFARNNEGLVSVLAGRAF